MLNGQQSDVADYEKLYHPDRVLKDPFFRVLDDKEVQSAGSDIVIANAGVGLWRDCIEMTDAELDWVMRCNLYAPIYLARAFARHWLGKPASVGGKASADEQQSDGDGAAARVQLNKRILCVASISGIVNMSPQRQVAYNASKAGLTMACRSLSGEWARYGITVNTISPGYVSTDMINRPPPGEGVEWPIKWKRDTPVDRFADPLEIGQMIVLMCSSEASTFITGHDLVIDGGFTTY